MVRHWKVTTMIISIIGMFVLYYMNVANEVETYPSFTLTTEKGSFDTVQMIHLYGDYENEESSQLFSLSGKETMYVQQMPYLERLSGFYRYAELERLMQLYPAYMRGKNADVSTYSESDFYIVQAEVNWGTYSGNRRSHIAFDLSVLHKELNKDARFHIEVPQSDQDSFLSLEDMYTVGEQLYLVTNHLREHSDGSTLFELRVYTIQLDRGKLTNSDVIYTWEQENPGEEIEVTSIENNHSIIADQRMLLVSRVSEAGMEVEDDLELIKNDAVDYEVIAYDFRTKGLETYKVPRAVKDGAKFISYEDNSDVYMIQKNGDELEILEWKVGSDEQTEPMKVPINRKPNTYITSFMGEHLYVYVSDQSHGKNIGELHVFYIPTGEWIYYGEVIADRSLSSEENVIIHKIE